MASRSFTIVVDCAIAADSGPLVHEEVTVAGDGVPVTATNDDGSPVLVPLGARCWGTEPSSLGATTVTIDHDSFDNGVEVVAGAELQELEITVTNTFELASLTVSKEVVEEPDPNAVYVFEVTCTIEDSDGTMVDAPLLTGQSPVSLGGDESATFDVLVGSVCTVTETSEGEATVTIAESGGTSDSNTSDRVVTVGGDAAVTVTNTFDPAVGGTGALPGTGAILLERLLTIAGLLVLVGSVLASAFAAHNRKQSVI